MPHVSYFNKAQALEAWKRDSLCAGCEFANTHTFEVEPGRWRAYTHCYMLECLSRGSYTEIVSQLYRIGSSNKCVEPIELLRQTHAAEKLEPELESEPEQPCFSSGIAKMMKG